MSRTTLAGLAGQLKTTQAALTRAEQRADFLVEQVERSEKALNLARDNTDAVRTQFSGVERRYREEATRRDELNRRIFERHDVEAMTRQQLVSLIEQAINEARRKGLVEAEGLVSRHRELTNETDLELMRGVISKYQARIAAIEADKAARAKQTTMPVVLDTRPLAEKIQTSTKSGWAWWQSSAQLEARDQTPTTNDFVAFDERAKVVEREAKAKSFVPGILPEGCRIPVKGTSGGTYLLERHGDVHSCTCSAWRYNRAATNRRTCKHLERYAGEKQEADRVNHRPKCHCGIELVRGQCRVHTRDWKGDEFCTCGRKFASCKAAYDTISVAQRSKGHQPELAAMVATGPRTSNTAGLRWA